MPTAGECTVPEDRRIETLRRYFPPRTARDPELDRLTKLAADLLKVPMAVISTVDCDRINYVSQTGGALPAYDCQEGFCGSCVLHQEPWLISDASSDSRTAHHPHVMNAGVRFYCGAPLTSPDSHRLGALAVMDVVPRQVSPQDIETLTELAHMVMRELELRRLRDEALKQYQAELAQREIREDHVRGLMREVTHRSKNMLAVVLAFARQSTQPGQNLSDYQARLISRIEGLAHTQDLIAEGDWHGADLRRLIAPAR